MLTYPKWGRLSQVLLLLWTENIDLQMQVEMFELFSGCGKVTQACREAGRRCVSYDVLYSPGKAMDFTSPAGYALQPHLPRQVL